MNKVQKNNPSPNVIHLDQARFIKASETLANAFFTDPIQVRLFKDEEQRAAFLPKMFNAMLKTATASQGHLTTTEDFGAVAYWAPPGTDIKLSAMFRTGFAMPRVLIHMPLRAIITMLRVFNTLPKRRKANMPEHHWYLVVLGTDTSRQGEGLGSALLREGLDRADREGKQAYLETETEENVRFYEKFGFTVIEELPVERLGFPMWLMGRKPQ